MTIRQRMAIWEIRLAVRLGAFGDWWAACAAARLRGQVKFVSQGCAGDPAQPRPVEAEVMGKNVAADDPGLVSLGAKLVRTSAPEEGAVVKEAVMRSFTGADPLTIKKMRKEFVEFEPAFELQLGRQLLSDRGDGRE